MSDDQNQNDQNKIISSLFYFRLIIWFLIWTLAEYLLHRFNFSKVCLRWKKE